MKLLAAFFISYLFHLGIIWFSRKKRLFLDDQEKRQKVHTRIVPRIGGLGILLASALVIDDPFGRKLLIAAIPAFLAGFFEDLISGISPKIRLGVIMLSGVLAIGLLGSVVNDFEFALIPWPVAALFTLIMIAGITNAINIIDGLNGLASGFSILVLVFFSIAAYTVGDAELAVLFCKIGLATLAFFLLNFPRPYIFLGDSGAYFLGFTLVVSGIALISRNPAISSYFPFLMLFYPVWEVLFSMHRRYRKGVSVMSPDRLHFHTLLFKRTALSNSSSTALLLAANGLLCGLGLLFLKQSLVQVALVLAFIGIYTSAYRSLVRFKTRRVTKGTKRTVSRNAD